jgi:hypothetical protein
LGGQRKVCGSERSALCKSGKLIKTTQVRDVRRIDNRWVPVELVFKDELKTGKGTEFIIESIEFNADIPDYVFSKASLRR